MPVRAILKISLEDRMLSIRVPDCIPNVFGREKSNFVCEFRNHFDKDKNHIRKIDETVKIQSSYNGLHNVLRFTGSSLAEKYGFLDGEYVEVLFLSIERNQIKEGMLGRQKITKVSVPIFPTRMIEDLEFIPE